MDIVFRRRAIYTGLKPYLSNAELLMAIQFWEQEFASKPAYAVNVFISRCCKTPELKAKRSEMLRSVVNAMELSSSQLLPDPGSQLNLDLKSIEDRREERSLVLDSKTVVFEMLMTQFLSHLDNVASTRLKRVLANKLLQLKTKERRLSQMRDWLNEAVQNLETSFQQDFLQKTMNLAYVEMCAEVGAVKADVFLSNAIKATTPLSQDLHFKLHDLL